MSLVLLRYVDIAHYVIFQLSRPIISKPGTTCKCLIAMRMFASQKDGERKRLHNRNKRLQDRGGGGGAACHWT